MVDRARKRCDAPEARSLAAWRNVSAKALTEGSARQ